MAETEQILHSVDGPIGRIRLNNPKALNSLTEAMCKKMHELLMGWADDDAIRAVVVTGEGERAFCAGGDVRQVCKRIGRRRATKMILVVVLQGALVKG